MPPARQKAPCRRHCRWALACSTWLTRSAMCRVAKLPAQATRQASSTRKGLCRQSSRTCPVEGSTVDRCNPSHTIASPFSFGRSPGMPLPRSLGGSRLLTSIGVRSGLAAPMALRCLPFCYRLNSQVQYGARMSRSIGWYQACEWWQTVWPMPSRFRLLGSAASGMRQIPGLLGVE
ncbi:hypothetical protein D3C81_1585130 [compost metagenome]